MRLKLPSIILFGFTLGFGHVMAQESYQAKLVTESLLLDVVETNDKLVAVGERGHIIRSSDGASWTQDNVPSLATLTAVNYVGDKGWSVGHDAVILHDPGTGDWQVQMFEPDFERPFLDVVFFDQSHGIAVGAYGMFYRTTDGGLNWENEMHPAFLSQDDQDYLEEIKLEDEEFYLEELASILPHLNRVTIVGDALFLAGEAGLLAKSTDMGKSWQRLDIDYEGSFFDIYQDSTGVMYAAGLRGNLFRLDGDTNNWESVDSQSLASLNSMLSLQNNTLLVVGNNGTLVCVTDGQTKQNQTEDSQAITNAIVFNERVIGVTEAGIQVLSSYQDDRLCNKEKS